MKKLLAVLLGLAGLASFGSKAAESPAVITLEQAIQIALSENVSVKVADMEIQREEYAKKGTYASLFPTLDGTGSFQRTIKKQRMYMDFDMSALAGAMGNGSEGSDPLPEDAPSSNDGFEVGRWNTYAAGVNATMPLVNFQLYSSIKLSGQAVELAVEKARSSRLDMITEVKQAYYGVLLAKEALKVYEEVYDNAVANFELIQKKYSVQKVSELEYLRSKTNVAAAVPNVYNAENTVFLALWQLKAVMGVSLDMDLDVDGSLSDYAGTMFRDIHDNDNFDLEGNTVMRQFAVQAEQLAENIRLNKYAYLPSLGVAFSYSYTAMTNDFKFSEYKWSPYSYVGFSLTIPIFSGGKRHYNVKQAKIQAAELSAQQSDTERKLKIAARQYINTMETSLKSNISAQQTVELARKAYDISEKSYQIGKSTITDLNDAQLALTQAQLGESQTVYEFLVAKSNLEKTIGRDFIAEDGSVDLQNR